MIQDDFDASRLAGRLTGNEPWRSYATVPNGEAIAAAEKGGMRVVFPLANQLQLDIDDKLSHDRFWKMYSMADSLFDFVEMNEHPSKSAGEHHHISIALANPVSGIERILLQAILGSDPKRELLSYVRLLKGEPHPTLFFEKP